MLEESQERRAWFRAHVLPLEGELLRYAARIAPAEIDPEDLLQEAFLRVMSSNWREVRTPGAVLRTIMRNYVYDLLRRRGLVPFRQLNDIDLNELRNFEPDPEATLCSSQELRLLTGIVAGLPDSCRQIFILRKFNELPMKAIAEQLGLTVSTVEKHLSRALRLCSEGLARAEGERSSERKDDGARKARLEPDKVGSGRVGRSPIRAAFPG